MAFHGLGWIGYTWALLQSLSNYAQVYGAVLGRHTGYIQSTRYFFCRASLFTLLSTGAMLLFGLGFQGWLVLHLAYWIDCF